MFNIARFEKDAGWIKQASRGSRLNSRQIRSSMRIVARKATGRRPRRAYCEVLAARLR